MSKEPESQTQSPRSHSQSQTQSPPSGSQAQTQSQTGSSSSSGPASASQSSSGTLSSVDTIPVPLASVPEEPEPHPWGRLLPMGSGFRAHDCIEDQYEFGRDSSCHYVIGDPNQRASKRFRIYSKKHFRIYREDGTVYIEDLSNNGTFVDGTRVGKDKKIPLTNNAVLSLSGERNKVFVFIDLMTDEQTNFPKEFQEKYVVTRVIGTGVCGEVKLAFHRSSCKKVAVKIINKHNFPSVGTATRNAEREIEILRRIDHPCLIKTEDFYQTEDSYYIILELMDGGELFQRVKSRQKLDEGVAKLYFYQMLHAVQYLHRNGIIHRDLKPENILLSSHDDVCLIKVTDFNQSKILEESSLMRTLCGTPSYLAPEVFTQTGYGPAVDAWSLGVLLFICLSGYPPFYEEPDGLPIREQIIRGEFSMIPKRWKDASDQAKDLVRKLLVVDPSRRLNIDQALQHSWLQDPEMLEQAHSIMYPAPVDDAVEDPVVLDQAPGDSPENAMENPVVLEQAHSASSENTTEDPVLLEKAHGASSEITTEQPRDASPGQQGASSRKRSREDEEGEELPAKRHQAPPTKR